MLTHEEIFDALVQRLLAKGEGQATVAERAWFMIGNWYKYSSNSVDDRGHETCRDRLDPEVVRLLDDSLNLTGGNYDPRWEILAAERTISQ